MTILILLVVPPISNWQRTASTVLYLGRVLLVHFALGWKVLMAVIQLQAITCPRTALPTAQAFPSSVTKKRSNSEDRHLEEPVNTFAQAGCQSMES